jgi:uncharacterized protein YeaO (DUF488 family)
LRLGTVRRPPRGVPRAAFASRNYYDVWLPALAPTEELRKLGLVAKSEKDWRSFVRRYRAEMKQTEKRCLLDLLAAVSREMSFSIGCYCVDAQRCRRSVLRELLAECGALLA